MSDHDPSYLDVRQLKLAGAHHSEHLYGFCSEVMLTFDSPQSPDGKFRCVVKMAKGDTMLEVAKAITLLAEHVTLTQRIPVTSLGFTVSTKGYQEVIEAAAAREEDQS